MRPHGRRRLRQHRHDPSKTLREAVLYLTGIASSGMYGQSYRVKDDITIDDLLCADRST